GTFFNSAGVLTSAATNAPRFDYNPATLAAQGLLIEESRANLLLQSEAFNTTWTTSNASITANSTTAPSATTTADTLVEDTATNFHYVQQTVSGTTNTNNYTMSCFIKASTRTAARIAIIEGTTFSRQVRATVDLSAGTVVGAALNSATLTAATIQAVGNSWYRVTVAGVLGGTDTNILCVVYVGQDTATFSYTGDGTSGVFIWGAQLEAGAFPTSYIPTTTTALTRAADVASVNTLSPWYNASEGTLFAESSVNYTVPGTVFPLAASLNDNTANNRIEIGYVTAVVAGFEVSTGGVVQAGLYPPTASQTRKTAGAYATNDFAVSTNGSAPLTDTSGTVPTVTRLGIGQRTSVSGPIYLRRITYYPRRLSNAELVSITS
ncbi:MAG: hypothetical protein ACK528_08940, partial [Alphaproteobacteria bacterium]